MRGPKAKAIIKVRNLLKDNKEMSERVLPVDKDHLNVMHIYLDSVGR